jgi:AhpD family alkylhydroperoxidase
MALSGAGKRSRVRDALTQDAVTARSREDDVNAHQTTKELLEPARRLREAIPEVIGGYAAMQRAVMVDGALPVKVKELIALAIAATRECDGCIAAHARGAARAQASEAEVAEAMGVVMMMNGGPGTVWGPRAAAAHREFGAPVPQH